MLVGLFLFGLLGVGLCFFGIGTCDHNSPTWQMAGKFCVVFGVMMFGLAIAGAAVEIVMRRWEAEDEASDDDVLADGERPS